MVYQESNQNSRMLPVHLYYIASVENKNTHNYLPLVSNSLRAQKQTKADIFLNKAADKSSAGWHFIQNQSVRMPVESKAKFCSISFEKAG